MVFDSPLLQLPNTYRAFYSAFSYLNSNQKRSILPILQGKDLILQAATGSGKTEAVLAPCMERIIQAGCKKSVIYIVPTRALALDLERRFIPVLVDKLGLRVGIRTGDAKRFSGGKPELLLTTPESLDVMLGSSNADIRGFFRQIGTVIIDEVHSLVHTYRGQQLVYLLRRMEQRRQDRFQRIALSATIADVETVVRFFNFLNDTVRLITPVQRQIIPHLVHLKNDEHELVALVNDLYQKWNYRKILIFANSRGACDRIFVTLNEQGSFRGKVELHYSNLKTKERQKVEYRFRRNRHALCVATSTLELGIDIGDVDGALLYEPPDSVSTFLQRIGRSNRRKNHTHFWGISRGPQAGRQLLRFLGLLRLTNMGEVEQHTAKNLHSVLIQQILSCLYEKKQISLASLQTLFSNQREVITQLFESMINQQWVRAAQIRGLFRGGWRYRDKFLEQKIWSNFPETEEDYNLEVSGETIADIPASIIRQLDPGDCVRLTGRRLQVLSIIETGEKKRLLAQPVNQLDEKEIFWLGCGFQASYEVAQSIKTILEQPDNQLQASESGLFSRTRKLLETEFAQSKAVVILANGIMAGRRPNGLYRYWTFLGSIGNLVLQWCIEHGPGKQLEEFTISSDETGLDCSHWIDFENLNLPENRKKFQYWVRQYLKPLKALVPLNAFTRFLPSSMLIEELSDFLFDQRVADTFSRYLTLSSEIKSGNSENLEWPSSTLAAAPSQFSQEAFGKPLLELEKQRWNINNQSCFVISRDVQYKERALTGTMLGEYIRHQQCDRWLEFNFLPTEQLPPRSTLIDKNIGISRIERGRLHETRAMKYLASHCDESITIKETDLKGNPISLHKRSEQFIEHLKSILQQIKETPEKSFIIAQAVLIKHDLLNKHFLKTEGVGIPDFIRVSTQDNRVLMEPGDIKDSRSPGYHQKWQVAFYAFLLKAMIARLSLRTDIHVSSYGILLTRSDSNNIPERHVFDLTAYLASIPALLEKIGFFLQKHPYDASCRLEAHCTTCPYFEYCYREALSTEDILFLPQLTRGILEKLRSKGLKNVESAYSKLSEEDFKAHFSPHQQKFLKEILTAFKNNRILLKQEKTRLFPSNISTFIFFYILENPFTGLPCSFAWEARDQRGKILKSHYCVLIQEEKLSETWREFTNQLLYFWDECITETTGPHLFHFGEQQLRLFLYGETSEMLEIFVETKPEYHTDLAKVLSSHFYFPIPGRMTLLALGQLLNIKPALVASESLFHSDGPSTLQYNDMTSVDHQKERTYLETLIENQARIKQWIDSLLKSEWEQENWKMIPIKEQAWKTSYLRFIEEEKRLKEEDIISLQALSLQERIDRFRAIGPLKFFETSLDDEGKFIYGFQFDPQIGFSKFREGDFLKLSPIGLTNLQDGFSVILYSYDQNIGKLWLRSRSRNLLLNKRIEHSLEEDISDWTSPRLTHLIRTVFSTDNPHPLTRLLSGKWLPNTNREDLHWVEQWLKSSHIRTNLNPTQQHALTLPFRSSLGLIKGPPGTGKTHVLGWTLIALIQRAQEKKIPLRIVVTALTHRAIDLILQKVTQLINKNGLKDFQVECFKWGRRIEDEQEDGKNKIKQLNNRDELSAYPYLILGSTGFGLYQLFEGQQGRFPQFFDWVIFDEASQVLISQALLSLVYGKGRFLFFGDVKQLPPIVLGNYDKKRMSIPVSRSILSCLLDHYDNDQCVQLDRTYRMNREICHFPGKLWYGNNLYPAKENEGSRITLESFCENDLFDQVLNPERPVTLLLTRHRGAHQKSDHEVDIIAELTERLIIRHGLQSNQIAIISPHRTQNNAITERLETLLKKADIPIPVIDTVERMQGSERDVIIFSLTTSDSDQVESEFLNNPNRFNVVITRAKKKLIIVGSHAFFSNIAHTEEALESNACFKMFLDYCQKHDALFFCPDEN